MCLTSILSRASDVLAFFSFVHFFSLFYLYSFVADIFSDVAFFSLRCELHHTNVQFSVLLDALHVHNRTIVRQDYIFYILFDVVFYLTMFRRNQKQSTKKKPTQHSGCCNENIHQSHPNRNWLKNNNNNFYMFSFCLALYSFFFNTFIL